MGLHDFIALHGFILHKRHQNPLNYKQLKIVMGNPEVTDFFGRAMEKAHMDVKSVNQSIKSMLLLGLPN